MTCSPATVHPALTPAAPRGMRLRAALLALLFVLLWASAFPAAYFVFPDAPPLLFLAVRYALAGGLLCAWAWRRGELRGLDRRGLAVLTLLAALNHAAYLGLSWPAMQQLSAGLATIVIGANPIVVALFSALLLGETLTRRKLLGLMLGFAGMASVVLSRVQAGTDQIGGLPLIFLALFNLALGTVLYKRLPVRIGLAGHIGLQNLLAALMLAPVALWLESPSQVHLSLPLLAAFVWLVLVVSIGAYLIWFWLLQAGEATQVSAWMFLTPPLGLLAGSWILHEPVQASDYLGVLPLVLGIVLVTRTPRARDCTKAKIATLRSR